MRPSWDEVSSENEVTKIYWAQWQNLKLQEGLLYRLWEDPTGKYTILQLIIPKSLRKQALGYLHNTPSGHFGVAKTVGRVRERFY